MKPTGAVRICVGLEKLNENIKRERYQLPTTEETLAKLSGSTVFTSLDAASGFWQILLHEDSSTLTTFITPFGRYCFKRWIHPPACKFIRIWRVAGANFHPWYTYWEKKCKYFHCLQQCTSFFLHHNCKRQTFLIVLIPWVSNASEQIMDIITYHNGHVLFKYTWYLNVS